MWLALLSNEVNFYMEEELVEEGSIVPFLMFCVFVAGIVVIVYGAVNFFAEWRDFRIFYDAQALEEKPDLQIKKKKMIKNGLWIGFGVLLIIISYL